MRKTKGKLIESEWEADVARMIDVQHNIDPDSEEMKKYLKQMLEKYGDWNYNVLLFTAWNKMDDAGIKDYDERDDL